jgi:hypothetical protein
MALRITNISRSLVLVRLLSGRTIHLAAGEQSGEVPEPELRGNPRVQTLVERNLVALDDPAPPRKPARSAKGAQTKGAEAKAAAEKGESS